MRGGGRCALRSAPAASRSRRDSAARTAAMSTRFAPSTRRWRNRPHRRRRLDCEDRQVMLRNESLSAPRPTNDPIITRSMESIDTQFATRRSVALQPGMLQAALLDRLTRAMGKSLDAATPRDIYDALSLAVREELTLRWLATQRRVTHARVKRVCYLSVEYLPGRSLLNALHSLEGDFVQEARAALRSMGYELDDIAAQEVDPGLGQRRFGPARCVLPRFPRHAPIPGRWVRHPLRLRDIHPGDRRRWRSARDRQQLAAAAQRVGNAARERALHRALRRMQRGAAVAPGSGNRIDGSTRRTFTPSASTN